MRSIRSAKPKWIHGLLSTAAVTAGALCAFAITPAALAAEPINIGVMAPASQIDGKAIINAAELAADQLNSQGGIDGRKIQLHVYDTHFSASNATRAFQRAVDHDHVIAVTGIFTSEVALAEMPWAARLKTPLLITGAASSAIPEKVRAQPNRFKYVFHSYVNSIILAENACTVAKDMREQDKQLDGFDRAVIFAENADWTKPVVATYKKCLPKAGLKIVDSIVFSPNTTDFSPMYSRIERDHANVIMAAIAHVGVKPVVQWHQQQVPALFSGINGQGTSSEFWNATNGATEDVIVSGSPACCGAPITDKTVAFYDAYRKRFHVNEPAYDAYTTYDAMHTIFHALKRNGVKGGEDLVKALAKTDFTGVLGRVAFHGLHDKYAHEVISSPDPKKGQSFLVVQWQSGKQVIVWPQRLATGKVQIPSFVSASKAK